MERRQAVAILGQALRDLGSALDAMDHGADEWADRMTAEAHDAIRRTLWALGEADPEGFARDFPDTATALAATKHPDGPEAVEVDEREVERFVTHGGRPPTWEELPAGARLVEALRTHDVELVRSAVATGAGLDVGYGDHEPPLLTAAGSHDSTIAEELLRLGADVRIRGPFGKTPLLVAAASGMIPIVEAALAAGVPPDEPADDGTTPLMQAAYHGRVDVMNLLLRRGADPNARGGAFCADSVTPLHRAAESGASDAARRLLDAGADRDALDAHGRTPLDVARHWNRGEVVAMLEAT